MWSRVADVHVSYETGTPRSADVYLSVSLQHVPCAVSVASIAESCCEPIVLDPNPDHFDVSLSLFKPT